MTYSDSVLITETCLALIASIAEKIIQRAILKRIEELADSPVDELAKKLLRAGLLEPGSR